MPSYNKNTDYEALIQEAVRRGSMVEAAALEQIRNQKIVGEGLNYQQTNRYSNYLQQQQQMPMQTMQTVQPVQTGYQSPYAQQIQDALAGLQGSSWSGWDKDSDPSYQAYRKEYLREADRSMEDTLGQYAMNTGGVASSAAITAASQAADYYKSQLADKVPELYQNAYSRYLNDIQNKQQNLSLLMQQDQNEANRYYDQINAAMTRWEQMGYADNQVASILGVGVGTPTSDQSYTNWSTAFQERQYNDQLAQQQAKLAASAGGGNGSGTGEGTGVTGTDGEENAANVQYMTWKEYNAMVKSIQDNPERAGEILRKNYDRMTEEQKNNYKKWSKLP